MNYITPDIEAKNEFAKLENNVAITHLEIAGIKLYSICRFYLEMCYRIGYYNSINKKKFQSEPEPNVEPIATRKNSLFNRIVNKFYYFFFNKQNNYRKSKYLKQFDDASVGTANVDYLIVATSSWMDDKSYSIELYSLIKVLKEQKKTIAFVLPNYSTKIKRRKEYDYFYTMDINKLVSFNATEVAVIDQFKSNLSKYATCLTQQNIDRISYHVSYILSLANQLTDIIKVVKPKHVVARSLYSDKWVPLACNKANVSCIEVQHGVFTKNNFYYHSLSQLTHKELLIPDFIFCLGNEWLKILRNSSPLWHGNNSGLIGTSINVAPKNTSQTGKKIVTIAFQDFSYELLDIRKDINDFLLKYASQLPDIQFCLRVHPADTEKGLSYFNLTDSIVLSNPVKETVADVLKKTDVLICATSMLMYEALSHNIPVISFEKFRKMCEVEFINFIKDIDELFAILLTSSYLKPTNVEYINPFTINDFNVLINGK